MEKAITVTISEYKQINHHETIVGFVNNDIPPQHCHTSLVSLFELIQPKIIMIRVSNGEKSLMTYCLGRT